MLLFNVSKLLYIVLDLKLVYTFIFVGFITCKTKLKYNQGVFYHTILSLLLEAKKDTTRDHTEVGIELYAEEMLSSK